MASTLTRPREGAVIAGVCAGLAERFGWSPFAVRLVFLLSCLLPGPQFLMGQLTIAGLDLNGEFEVKRIWTMKEGKPFNPEYPDFFLNRVREQGVFDDLGQTKSEIQVNEQTRTDPHAHAGDGDAGVLPRADAARATDESPDAFDFPLRVEW